MRVGFVGLGNLGAPMARALVRAGFEVTVVDRDADRAEACVAEGAARGDVAGCDVVAVAVPDDAAVEQVVAELPREALVLVHSTILPGTARRLAERWPALLDAPVSGGPDRALAGDLTVMVGGAEDVFERAREVLDAVGSDVRHVGPSGAGAAVKLANQLMMLSALAGVHEALDLTQAYGVDDRAVLDAVATGTGDSWVARHWGFFDDVARAYDEGGTPVRSRPWSKDLWDVVAAAREADVDVPVAGLLSQIVAARVEAHARR
ncbi:MAG TPA: NAD(P)-dependent oxidoreductase [Solirubrobacter sp.]|nr:NAD(P)-dependent oxidoreductase [Solirubrobacter sp.]